MNKFQDLNERFVLFAVACIQLAEKLPSTYAGNYLAGQITRSGTAPALQYGEVQGAESSRDFVHKFKILLKELRETLNALRIITHLGWIPQDTLEKIKNENNQLVAISVASIKTATSKKKP